MDKNRYFETPKLQIALDLINLKTALKIALNVTKSVDIFEAGTPLIKAEGIKAVTELKKRLPDKMVLADMKTLDVGWVEVTLASEAGADIVSVSGLAPNEVIQESVKAAREKNAILKADLLGVKEPLKRAIELKDLGVDMICVHTAIDQEKTGVKFEEKLDLVRSIVERTGLIVSAAGGLNLNNVGSMIKAGAKVIVVGRAITTCQEPGRMASLFKEEINKNIRRIER
ncbi:MAG: orotidine 5'-phosphate decarboxylase / HUMPS family protein [Nitrososphaeria archaeon]